jgi:hypothetical protein
LFEPPMTGHKPSRASLCLLCRTHPREC